MYGSISQQKYRQDMVKILYEILGITSVRKGQECPSKNRRGSIMALLYNTRHIILFMKHLSH